MDMVETGSFMELSTKLSARVSSNESMKSCEKVRDCRISDLEEKLAMAEDRCSVLRNQVAYMKMLYTNHTTQGNANEEESYQASGEKMDKNVRNAVSNPNCYRGETEDLKTMPANMVVKPLFGTPLAKDPKDAMEMIVHEMTQSVNGMEGGFNIHSNMIEGVMLSSRHRKKRNAKKDEKSTPKVKKNSTATNNCENVTKHANGSADRKSLDSKSRISINSGKTAKKRANSMSNAGHKLRMIQGKSQEHPLSARENLKRQLKAETDMHLDDSDAAIPKVTSSTYLLPTFSFRMKCVPKSYRREYSFHRIPFVLGKSTNKSHNLGAKIQETLSMLKLSRKGLHASSNMSKKEELTNLLQNSNPTSAAAHIDSSLCQAASSSQSKNLSPPMTSGTSTDYKNYQLRTVLMNLHDEFSKMTENYEALRASLRGKLDPETARRIQTLEEELNTKEIEINAFMNLYNEVSQLKDKLSSSKTTNPTNAMYRPSTGYPESTSTLKMTRLLRRIEEFQHQLKSMAYI